jgi:hypothetical protein
MTLTEVLGSTMLIHLWEAPGCVLPGTRVPAPSRRERWDGQLGGEILAARANHWVEKWWCGLVPGLVLFRLVAPPLQLGVAGLFS